MKLTCNNIRRSVLIINFLKEIDSFEMGNPSKLPS